MRTPEEVAEDVILTIKRNPIPIVQVDTLKSKFKNQPLFDIVYKKLLLNDIIQETILGVQIGANVNGIQNLKELFKDVIYSIKIIKHSPYKPPKPPGLLRRSLKRIGHTLRTHRKAIAEAIAWIVGVGSGAIVIYQYFLE